MAEEKADWDYKPDEPKARVARGSTRTINWSASEYIDHKRGITWYLLLATGTAAVAAVVYLLTSDITAVIAIAAAGLVVGSVAHWKPRQIEYSISPEGLQVGDKAYGYSQFKTFSIVHEGQLSSLVFNPLKRFAPPISIFFDQDDEDKITAVVGEHLPLEDSPPDRVDRLSRRLRF